MALKTARRIHYAPWVRWVGRTVLRVLGWTVEGERPEEPKAVLTLAPHTSNFDLFFGMMASWALDIPMVFVMKQSWFFWPLGPIFCWLGGIPVDRDNPQTMMRQILQFFKESEVLFLAITPEGTRSQVDYWKLGFYMTARRARVPLLLCFLDYKHRRVGPKLIVPVTGDLDGDFAKIRAFYEEEVGITYNYEPRESDKKQGSDGN